MRERGTTVQKFFQDNLEAVYRLRLGGSNLEVYNLERTEEELKTRIAEKDSEIKEEADRRNLQEEGMEEEEVRQEEEDVGNHGGNRKLALAAMVGGTFLVGGALEHHLRLLLSYMKSVKKVFHDQVRP